MHFAIVDDLQLDRKRLKDAILSSCLEYKISSDFSMYESGESFLLNFRSEIFDAVFLDIILGGISGIKIAKKIREIDQRLPIIFTTNEESFALDGYSVHATDYLVKPVDKDKVSWCIQQLKKYINEPSHIKIKVADKSGVFINQSVILDDILYGEYQSRCVNIHTVSEVLRTPLSFQELEDLLPKSGRFIVCNRGILVNLSQVETVAEGSIILKTGEQVQISRRKQPEILKAFTSYSFTLTRNGGWT